MKIAVFTALIAASALPQAVSAQVIISEFMYDAPGTDDKQEWVELYNAGSNPIDLTKWKISDGSNHTLNAPPKNGGRGSLIIEPGGYLVLADDAAAFAAHYPNVANVIDTTLSFSNTAGTVLLSDAGQSPAAAVDSVPYTKELGAAGDGNSLQKNGGTWIPSAPTPGGANAAAAAPPKTDTPAQASGSTTQTQAPAPIPWYVPPPEPKVFADAGGDRTVIVGADARFDARAYNRDKETLEHVRFVWNFGDGTVAEGASVLHHFRYPGRYAVVLSVSKDMQAVADRIIVTAEPARLSFIVNGDGSIAIGNLSGHDLDLSHWLVRSYSREFILPDDSVVLSGESMRISNATLGFPVGEQTELRYPNGTTALHAGEQATEPAAAVALPPAPEPVRARVVPAARTAERSLAADETGNGSAPVTEEISMAYTRAHAAAASGAGVYSWWWFGALALALSGGGLFAALRHVKRGEWTIIEDSE